MRIPSRCILVLSCAMAVSASPAVRNVRIDGQNFVLAATNEPIVLAGPNIVVKGPPYLPSVSGNSACNDDFINAKCSGTGTCTTCSTFNQADVAHIKAMGWNFIRLSVVWAGAQPRDEDALDPEFVRRLHDILNLTDQTGLHVMLDNHGDMVGGAGCGNGVPMWVSKKAAPNLIGQPLKTGWPYDWISDLQVTKAGGYSHCGDDKEKWAAHAGDPNYNLLNECCMALNGGGNPKQLGWTTISQKTMDYVVADDEGRQDFIRYWKLMAEAVQDHPSAFAAELMNEPMSIKRPEMFETWKATAKAINAVIPDMSVALADTGEGAIFPKWLVDVFGPGIALWPSTEAWIKEAKTVFYSWHWYGDPEKPEDAIQNAQALGKNWNVPTFATEFMSCNIWNLTEAAKISRSYWHYSAYCNTGPDFGNRTVPTDTFGACILGWGGGTPSYTCTKTHNTVAEVVV